MSWAKLWAIFSQARPVTLIVCAVPPKFAQSRNFYFEAEPPLIVDAADRSGDAVGHEMMTNVPTAGDRGGPRLLGVHSCRRLADLIPVSH
jgi:hypothetical protein